MSENRQEHATGHVFEQLDALEKSGFPRIAEFLRSMLENAKGFVPHDKARRMGGQGTGGVTRTDDGWVTVGDKQAMMSVFLDRDRNYSVSGYAGRAGHCFGAFYLCLDPGPEYEAQATKVNAAIRQITREDSYMLAVRETGDVLASDPSTPLDKVLIKVLSRVCHQWFGLPDGVHIVEGPPGAPSAAPPTCPGSFSLTSGFIFSGHPNPILQQLGPPSGQRLKSAGTTAVPGLRQMSLPPHSLTRSILDAFEDDDLAARTIVGVMMGMLPTVDENVKHVMATWSANGGAELAALRKALAEHGGSDPFRRASEVLTTPFMLTMQRNPVPLDVWRTATRDHVLHGTEVKAGDKIDLLIGTVTGADAAAGVADVFPVFGGNRGNEEHGTHACPGYEAAMGVMLGVVHGLLEPQAAPTGAAHA